MSKKTKEPESFYKFPGKSPEEADGMYQAFAEIAEGVNLDDGDEETRVALLLAKAARKKGHAWHDVIYHYDDKEALLHFRVTAARQAMRRLLHVTVEDGVEQARHAAVNVKIITNNPGHMRQDYQTGATVFERQDYLLAHSRDNLSRVKRCVANAEEFDLHKRYPGWAKLRKVLDDGKLWPDHE